MLPERQNRYGLRKFVDAVLDADGQSFLEKNTVDKKTRFLYDSSLRSFLAFVDAEKLPLKSGKDWDEALVVFMKRRFFLRATRPTLPRR